MDREIESRLVARIRDGDLKAFDAVYEAFRPRLFSFLVRLTRRRDVAEDLLEETWLRFASHGAALDADTRLAPWLFTVARNLYASWCRHRAVDLTRLSELSPSWPAPGPGETPFESAARSETERRLERALARLTSGDREVLLLVAVEELTPSEAAVVLGVAPEALRKRLQRARERLSTALDAEPAVRRARAG